MFIRGDKYSILRCSIMYKAREQLTVRVDNLIG